MAALDPSRGEQHLEENRYTEFGPKHKVFLSHSGAQKDFVEDLCVALETRHFPFFDKSLSYYGPTDTDFPSFILKATKECHVAVIVLSEEFISSKWPMMELAAFHEAQQEGNPQLKILPLFFKLSVTDLDEPSIEDRWMPKWREHARTHHINDSTSSIDLNKWSAAVTSLLKANGPIFDKFAKSDVSYRSAVTQEIFNLSPPHLAYGNSRSVVGCGQLCEILSNQFAEDKKSGTLWLGLYGMGGLGKTTMSRALCDHFQGDFLGRVCHVELGEASKALMRLKQVLTKLCSIEDDELYQIKDTHTGWKRMQNCLKQRKVFLVIDNVTDECSLGEAREYLAAGFHRKSRIMITSRSRDIVEKLLSESRLCKPMPYLTEEDVGTVNFLKKECMIWMDWGREFIEKPKRELISETHCSSLQPSDVVAFDPHEAVPIMIKKIALSMSYLQPRGIVHREPKPSKSVQGGLSSYFYSNSRRFSQHCSHSTRDVLDASGNSYTMAHDFTKLDAAAQAMDYEAQTSNSLFPVNVVDSYAPRLKNLKLPELRCRVYSNDDNDDGLAIIRGLVSLQPLTLSGCESLKGLPERFRGLGSLRSLDLARWCELDNLSALDELPAIIGGEFASLPYLDLEDRRKRIRTRNWNAEEIRTLLKVTEEALGTNVGPDTWDYVSENLWEQYGFDRDSDSCENLWGSLLQCYRAIRNHESQIHLGSLRSCVGYWEMDEDQRFNNNLPRAFDLEWYEMIDRILAAKPFGGKTRIFQRDADLPSSVLPLWQFQASAIMGHFGSGDCDKVMNGDSSDDRKEYGSESEDNGSSGDSIATLESQAEATADSHVPRTRQSHEPRHNTGSNYAGRKRTAATFDEDLQDDLISRVAPFVNKQIENALKPLISVLRGRKEDEQKHQEKLLVIEEQKLALKREKMQLFKLPWGPFKSV